MTAWMTCLRTDSRLLCAGVAIALCALAAAPGARAEGPAVLVAPAVTSPELEGIRLGYDAWLAHRIAGTGAQVLQSGALDALARPPELPLDRALAAAAERGATYALLPDLRTLGFELEARLRLYAVPGGELLAVTRATSIVNEVGIACEDTVVRILGPLGISARAAGPGSPPLLDELASTHRAAEHVRDGRLVRAWREVQGKLSPTAMRTPEAIVAEAQGREAPAAERARVLAVTGDTRTAWHVVSGHNEEQQRAGVTDVATIVAAGEVQLERNNPREARTYFEEALRLDPKSYDAQVGLGRVHALQRNPKKARAAFSRAAKLDPKDPRPLVLESELETTAPDRQAALLMRAARRTGDRLDMHRASRLFERAAYVDSSVAGGSWLEIAQLNEKLGLHAEALVAYEHAAEAGAGGAAVYRGIGRTQRRLGNTPAAEAAFRRAVSQENANVDALHELGELYTENGRAGEAVPVLERALEIAPERPATRRSLARALRANGESERALESLAIEDLATHEDPEALRELAAIQLELERPADARHALSRAVELSPYDSELRDDLADAYEAEGRTAVAAQERKAARLLAGVPEDPATTRSLVAHSFDDLLLSFASEVRDARNRRVAELGIRVTHRDWKQVARAWLHPRTPDLGHVQESLRKAIDVRFDRVEAIPAADDPLFDRRLDRLFAFDSETSLGADSIAGVNLSLDTDAVFLARLDPAPEGVAEGHESDPACADPERFTLELRMLSGKHADEASILVNLECLPGSVAAYGAWNPRAAGLYAIALLIALSPLIRGWGRIRVTIKLPPHTKGFFSIKISTKPQKAGQEKDGRNKSGRLSRSLRSLSRFERRMVGKETLFTWIPARKRRYYVVVRGPLMEAMGDNIIGHFLEEKTIRVVRGRVSELEYDFCPKEIAIEVKVLFDGEMAADARVAQREVPGSLRYARGGVCFIYAGLGTHTILVGARDRVAAREVEVATLTNAIPLPIDLGDEEGLVFQDCPDAVEPYLQGDFGRAADALEAAGQQRVAHGVRAALHRKRGDLDRAVLELEAAGEVERAAELRAANGDNAAAGALFEKAGNFARAGESYRETGDLASAARCYEAAYDYDNALECYGDIHDTDKMMELLEKTGDYLEAASLARAEGDVERAVRNLEQVDRMQESFGDACEALAEIAGERGDWELAIGRYDLAIEVAGGENAPVDLHERRADALAEAGRAEEAIRAYETVRHREPGRSHVVDRIDTLRKEISQATEADSRYEILGELGRGGMGVVFKARDKRLGRMVALKRLPENMKDHPAWVQLFLGEAQAAAALNHRNIVTVFDAGEENGVYFITMEMLEGLPLNHVLQKRKRLSPRDVSKLGIQIAAGLQYAHERRIVHRDIKTANLFVTRDRVVKIMDFGIAKTIEEVRRSSTFVGGTPFYMAPEQADGENVDHRADLYAFGVTLFELLTGQVPWKDGDIAYHRRHTRPPDPRESFQGIPDELAELILKLLAKDPADRPADAAEAGRCLEAVIAVTES